MFVYLCSKNLFKLIIMRKISKELMGASSIPLILSILLTQDTYGYEIMKRLKESSEGRLVWKEGSLYPVLKKMEELKYIKSYWNIKDFDRPRKYYKILSGGHAALNNAREDWALMQTIFNDLWAAQTVSN